MELATIVKTNDWKRPSIQKPSTKRFNVTVPALKNITAGVEMENAATNMIASLKSFLDFVFNLHSYDWQHFSYQSSFLYIVI